MKQVSFIWDRAGDMVPMNDFVNEELERLHKKHFKILEIKSFGKSSISIKNGGITYDIYDEDTTGKKVLRREDTSDVEGILICIVYDDNR